MSNKPKAIETDFPFAVFSHEADHDYILARWIAFAGGGFHTRAGFLAHQACEKYLKALSVQANGTYLQTHRLSALADYATPHYGFLRHEAGRDDLNKFDPFEQVGRYGGAASYDPLRSSVTGNMEVPGVSFWDYTYLPALDRIVFNMRGRLRFPEINFADSLHAIVTKAGTSPIEQLWTGQPSIFDVLTRGNDYFSASGYPQHS